MCTVGYNKFDIQPMKKKPYKQGQGAIYFPSGQQQNENSLLGRLLKKTVETEGRFNNRRESLLKFYQTAQTPSHHPFVPIRQYVRICVGYDG